jgi:HK97 family phage prohead protease
MNRPNLTIPLEVKGLADREFEGHGSIFKNVDLGGDIVVPGAFKNSLAQHKKSGSLPALFWMHDPSRVAGKWTEMSEDSDGLKVKGVLAPTPLGDEIHTLLKMEAVKGLSIGYRTLDHDYDKDGNRLIKEAELWEVSVVSLPMNPLAQVAHVKSRLSEKGEYVPTPKEFERTLRDAGCSRNVAKTILHKLFSDVDPRDAEEQKEQPCVDAGDEDVAAALQEVADRLTASLIKRPNI